MYSRYGAQAASFEALPTQQAAQHAAAAVAEGRSEADTHMHAETATSPAAGLRSLLPGLARSGADDELFVIAAVAWFILSGCKEDKNQLLLIVAALYLLGL